MECRGREEAERRRGWRGGASGFKDNKEKKGGREERTVTGRDTEIGGVVVSRRGRPAEKWTGPGFGLPVLKRRRQIRVGHAW